MFRDAALAEIVTAIRSADVFLVVAAFSFIFIGWLISTTRWRLLLRAQAVRPSFGRVFQAYVVALFFNNLLPSTVGGDTVRAYDSWRFGASRGAAVTVVFMDRLLGVVALLLFAAASVLTPNRVVEQLPALRFLVPAVLLGTLGSLLFLVAPRRASRGGDQRRRRVPGKLGNLVSVVRRAGALFGEDRRLLAKCLGLSVLLQANVVLQYAVLAKALGVPVPFPYFFIVVPLAVLVMMVPVTINGIGIRENVFAFLFGLFGVTTAVSVAFAWIAYGFLLVQAVIGGTVYALRR